MKKIIATLVAITAACTFITGCGKDSSSSSKSASVSDPDNYEPALRALFDAENEGDSEALMKAMYPAGLYDFMVDMGYEEELIQMSTGDKKKKEITDIIEEEELGEDDINEFEVMLTGMDEMMDLSKEYDLGKNKTIEDLSEEDQQKVAEKMEKIQNGDVDEIKYDVTKAFDITVKYDQDGEEEEDSFYAFYVDGEGWLFQESMRKFVEKSNQSSINSIANTISKSVNSALIDLDVDGVDISGTYIISSVPAKNYNVPEDIDLDELNKKIKNYFSDIDELYYFCLVSGGSAVYVACEKQDNKYTGVYPAMSVPEDDDSTSYFDTRPMKDDEEKLGLEELYDIAVENVK